MSTRSACELIDADATVNGNGYVRFVEGERTIELSYDELSSSNWSAVVSVGTEVKSFKATSPALISLYSDLSRCFDALSHRKDLLSYTEETLAGENLSRFDYRNLQLGSAIQIHCIQLDRSDYTGTDASHCQRYLPK